MVHHEFTVPDDRELVELFGVASEALDGVESTRLLRLVSENDDEVHLVYDTPGRSIHLKWLRRGMCVVEIFREEAVRLSVEDDDGKAFVSIAFDSNSLFGELRVQVRPRIWVSDRLLAR
ncbi:hypothetical protein [Kutzneria sp. NPDC052558]|uniref:hypothetical protein n=1 Tax=Kutzneria sp. NPDC052558 TaxID=3364121 RepID=UPI0037C804BD